MQKEENLNLKYNTDILIKKALEKYKTHREAYKALGMTERTFYNRINNLHGSERHPTRRNK